MKLLILTQRVDENDPILGFFHRWLEEFSKHCEQIKVICLYEGAHVLPANVEVLSLGKEKGESNFKYIRNFYLYIWSRRKDYDKVFVHMNEEYVLLGGILWKLLGKQVFFWRNHPRGGFLTRISVMLSKKVFCTSKFSFTARYKKTEIMPVGIDTAIFTNNPGSTRLPRSIVCIGRISPIKNIDVIINALGAIHRKGLLFTTAIVGDPMLGDESYLKSLRDLAHNDGIDGYVHFMKGIKNSLAPEIYNHYEIFINLTPSGSFDKTIIEAALCGCMLLVSNSDLRLSLSPESIVKEGDMEELERKLALMLGYSDKERAANIQRSLILGREHSLDALASKLFLSLQS